MHAHSGAFPSSWTWVLAQLRRTAQEAIFVLPVRGPTEDDESYVLRVLPRLRVRVEDIRPFRWSGKSGEELDELDRRLAKSFPQLELLPAEGA